MRYSVLFQTDSKDSSCHISKTCFHSAKMDMQVNIGSSVQTFNERQNICARKHLHI